MNYRVTNEIGRLMNDFHQVDPGKMHYPELARGVSHLKGTGGQENMCEAVQKYAEEYAKEYAKEYAAKEKSVSVKNLMHNMKLNLDEALNALGIQGDERELIIAQLQEQQ